jgi:hypothetical protein
MLAQRAALPIRLIGSGSGAMFIAIRRACGDRRRLVGQAK